jgi:hypothetical protein
MMDTVKDKRINCTVCDVLCVGQTWTAGKAGGKDSTLSKSGSTQKKQGTA